MPTRAASRARPCRICRHRLRGWPYRPAVPIGQIGRSICHRMPAQGNAIPPYDAPDQSHSDRSRGAPQPRHGAAAEPRAVSAAGHARSRHRGGRFHAGDRGPEYRLGAVAGAGRGDRRPLRSARDDARRGRHLRDRDGGDGDRVRRGAAAGLRRADRHRAVVHGVVAGADGGGPRGLRGAPQQDAGPRFGRRLARHADGAADDAEPAGEPPLADRRAVFPRAGRDDDPGRVPGRRRRTRFRRAAAARCRCARRSATRCGTAGFS